MTGKAEIKAKLLSLVDERGAEKTICPSEVVRSLEPESWRDLMPTCREVAFELAKQGQIEICRKGSPVDLHEIRGPIRLRQKRRT